MFYDTNLAEYLLYLMVYDPEGDRCSSNALHEGVSNLIINIIVSSNNRIVSIDPSFESNAAI